MRIVFEVSTDICIFYSGTSLHNGSTSLRQEKQHPPFLGKLSGI